MVTGQQTTQAAPTLRHGALSLRDVIVQGVAAIGPALSVVALLGVTVGLAGITAPLAFGLGGLVILAECVIVSRLALRWPSAGGWFTWIARSLSPRAGFIAGWFWIIWWPPIPLLTICLAAGVIIQPAVAAYYGVNIAWQWYALAMFVPVLAAALGGIKISARFLIITTGIEVVVLTALAVAGLASPGPGGFTAAPLNPALLHHAPDLFLGFVFSILAYTGWESVAPIAEESVSPRRNVPRGMLGAVLIYGAFFLLACWGILVGVGVGTGAAKIAADPVFPGFALAERLWGAAWVLVLIVLVNSAMAVAVGGFSGATRTLYAMGRAGALPAWFAQVSRRRKTPDAAIAVTTAIGAAGFAACWIWGVGPVYFTWATAITFGLIILYVLANAGVVRRWLADHTFGNPLVCVVLPLLATGALGLVFWKSIDPLPAAPLRWGPVVMAAWLTAGLAVLGVLRLRRREEWIGLAGQAFDEQEGPAS
jgi:amino acid transporter